MTEHNPMRRNLLKGAAVAASFAAVTSIRRHRKLGTSGHRLSR